MLIIVLSSKMARMEMQKKEVENKEKQWIINSGYEKEEEWNKEIAFCCPP